MYFELLKTASNQYDLDSMIDPATTCVSILTGGAVVGAVWVSCCIIERPKFLQHQRYHSRGKQRFKGSLGGRVDGSMQHPKAGCNSISALKNTQKYRTCVPERSHEKYGSDFFMIW